MRNRKQLIIIAVTFFLSATLLFAGGNEIDKSFAVKKKIKVKLILSDCTFIASEDNRINVHINYTYDSDGYDVSFKEKSSSITMKERFLEGSGNHSGDSYWQIAIPSGVKVKFNSATGDMIFTNVEINVNANTGTGEIEILNSRGDFDLNTGTGDIDVKDSRGEFDLNTGTGSIEIVNTSGSFSVNSGTGDVQGKMITIEDEADFNSGTGEAKIIHPLGNNFDLSLNSGTDDAVLDMDGVDIEGYFEFRANTKRGDIDCPNDFDREKEYGRGEQNITQKSFTRGTSKNRYYISTGNGTAKLIK